MVAYFVSDIHLQSPKDKEALQLERFFIVLLEQARHQTAQANPSWEPVHLFLVGDIFDLWVGNHRYFVDRFKVIVDLVRDLIREGVEVHFFEGNHDLHLREFWETELGAKVYTDAEYFDLDGVRVRVEHGDLMNPNDKGYLFLRWFLRTKIMRGLALNLPESMVAKIGEKASRASRDYTSGDGRKSISQKETLDIIHEHAKRVYQEEPFDLIITGHVHLRDDFELPVAGKKVRSINLGSWHEGAAILKVTTQQKEFTVDFVELQP
jgi:UDP-2,3-diacylglucosamine hydrolase